ncbi:hypothetical protein Syun_013336 [Stephania yunnanensis]|uniref:Uncharacterized protein n=1 Tax=Stephania yunnanensis TaxID=152371 RepID=A0AAP0PKB2_9MAGN
MADPTRQIDVAEDRDVDVVVVDSSLESSYLFELNLLTVLLSAASIPSSEEANCSDPDKKIIDVKNEGLNGGDGERGGFRRLRGRRSGDEKVLMDSS